MNLNLKKDQGDLREVFQYSKWTPGNLDNNSALTRSHKEKTKHSRYRLHL